MVEPRTFTEDPRTKYGSSRNNPETPSQADIATDSKRTGYDSWRIDHGLATDGHGLTTDYDEEATDNAGHMHREPTNKLYGCKTCEQATRMLPDFHRKAICITTDQTKKTKKKKKGGGEAILKSVHFPAYRHLQRHHCLLYTQVWRHGSSVKTQSHQQLQRHSHHVISYKATDIDAAGPVSMSDVETLSSITYESE